MVVAPGFIDIHAHSDLELLADGRGKSMVRQRVTTNVTGNCGMSVVPMDASSREEVEQSLAGSSYGLPWTWSSFGEWLDVLCSRPLAINVVPLVGHAAIRAAAMGF